MVVAVVRMSNMMKLRKCGTSFRGNIRRPSKMVALLTVRKLSATKRKKSKKLCSGIA